jgi:type II secretory pathway pseudopilin PulG
MEDFLYIFLAVIWLVISILGSKKKKQAQQQQKQQRQEQQSARNEETREYPTAQPTSQKEKEPSKDFEELLEDFFGAEPKPKEKQPKYQEATSPAYTKERTYQDDRKPERRFNEDIISEKVEEFEGADAITDDYEFSAEGKVETIEDLIRSYEDEYRKIEEKDKELIVVDLDEENVPEEEIEFDGRKAIIYSEIINRKYF